MKNFIHKINRALVAKKKLLTFIAATLFAGSMMAAEVTIEKTMSEIIEENGYTVSAGSDVTLYTSFDLNNVVTIFTSGKANCGSFWGTSPNNDWRLFQNKGGDITISADGVTLKKICITYNTSNGGALKTSAGIDIESGLEYDASGESVTYVVKNSGDKTNGQVRVTKIKVVYEDASVKVAAPVILPERAQFIKMAQVTITCATEGAEIYYTMDGSDPEKGKGGTFEYTGMFQFRKSPTIKAIAYKGEDKSEITTKQFEEVGLLTVSEAIEAMDQSSPILNRFVQGKIVSIKEGSFNEDNGTMTYFISDDGTATKQIQVYNGYGMEGEHFVTEMALQPGATVTVFGNLKIYQPKEGDPIYEIDQNSVITEYTGPVPQVSDLASKYDLANNVVLCFYFDAEPCNTVVLVGSYNGWSDIPDKCVKFEALDGFAGWYVAEAKYEAGFMAKPLQLDGRGSFAGWAYQAGDPAAWVNLGGVGSKEITLTAEGVGEAKAEYPQGAGAYIYELKYWKKKANPCATKYHNYTLYLFPPACNAKEDIFVPAINSPLSGSWKMEAMEQTIYDGEKVELQGEICYVYQANHVKEGSLYKFTDKTFGWDNQYQMWDAESESWKNVTDNGFTLPETDKADNEIVYDWRDGNKYRYPMCDTPIYDVDIAIKVPAGAPKAGVELMGSFIGGDDFGKPVTMVLKDGKYTARVQGVAKSLFRLREAGTWDNQVQIWDGEKFVNNEANWQFGEEWEDVLGCETCKLIDLDWSNSNPTGGDAYQWTDYNPIYYNLIVLSSDESKGTVSGGGSYQGNKVIISATPNNGYRFTQWSDGITDNPRTIILTQDTTFTAEFAKNTYTVITESNNPKWGTTAGDQAAQYLDKIEITATANYGYSFVQWNDGNTQNPRTITVTEDKTYTATFAKNTYNIIKNAENGLITGPSQAKYLDEVTLTATANTGYHFTQWSDGITNNPRSFIITQDTVFTAEFVKNTYTITTESNNPEWGNTTGGAALYLDKIEILATPNYGYYFVQWNDGNTQNPRTITVTEDKTYTATFAKNTYNIVKKADHGSISGPSQAKYLDEVTLTATANTGYHFTQWSDGITNNPRSFVITQDTAFTAEFAKNTYSITTRSNNSEWGTTSGDKSVLYLDKVEILATPNYGYYFVQWNDGNTQNPRTITVTEDKTYTATFAKNTYNIVKKADHGSISGPSQAKYLDEVTLTVTANTGYHFTQWADGVTDNPRSFVIMRDTAFTAEFAKNTYSITTESNNSEWGTTSGDKSVLYLDKVEILATPNYGYYFVHWNDGNTQNPRLVSVTEDKTYTAIFAKNTYNIVKNAEHGSISGPSQAEYLDEITLTVVSDYGYHFTKWSDGNTENPRSIVIKQDIALTAEFAIDKTGTCGKDNALIWSYDDQSNTLTITGNGELTDNYTFGLEAPTQMNTLIIGDGVTAIGDRAFYGIKTLNHLFIGANVASIGDHAFAECRNFDDITSYATIVPTINATTFANVGNKQYIYLFVPADRERAYKRDEFWGEFDIQIKSAETTTTDGEVKVVPTDNTAEIAWPSVNGADAYEIEITKDGEVFCVLKFNTNGQLVGIAFAPGRDAIHTQQAQTAGFKFTVTGLTSGTQYGYSISSKDNGGTTIDSKEGTFTTTSSIATAIENVQDDNVQCTKVIRDGQLYIMHGDMIFNASGMRVK